MEAKHLDANVQSPDSIAFAPDDTLYAATQAITLSVQWTWRPSAFAT